MNIGFIALYLFYYIVDKALGRVLRIRYNNESVLSDILYKEGIVTYRIRFSFLYQHFISIVATI